MVVISSGVLQFSSSSPERVIVAPRSSNMLSSELYLRPRYSGHGDKAINIISSPHPDSMGSRVVVVAGDDHNGLK